MSQAMVAPRHGRAADETRYYQENASLYDSTLATFYDLTTFPLLWLRRRVARLAGVRAGMRVLDVATGTGAQARASLRSWVTDSLHPGTLVLAPVARYLRSEGPGSPMGKGFRAFASVADAEHEQRRTGGVTMSWDEVLTVVGSDRATRG